MTTIIPDFRNMKEAKYFFLISLEIFRLEVLATSCTPKNQILSSDIPYPLAQALVLDVFPALEDSGFAGNLRFLEILP